MRKTVTELAMPEQGQRLIRLAPYTRVSSGSDDQLHSFAAQVKYYTEYAAAHRNTSWWTSTQMKRSPAHEWTSGMI